MHTVLCFSKAVVLFSDLINSADAVVSNVSHRNMVVKAHLINQIAILGCVFTEIYLQHENASFNALQGEKVVELICRLTGSIITVFNEATVRPNQIDLNSRILEKCVASISSLAAVLEEAQANLYHQYGQLSDKELEEIRNHPSPYDEGTLPPLNHNDCVAMEMGSLDIAIAATMIRAIADQGVGNKLRTALNPPQQPLNIPQPVEPELIPEIPSLTLRQRIHAQLRKLMEQCEQDALRIQDARLLPFIPEKYHHDAFFLLNVDPILLQPIRDPVRDPATGMIYERLAIQYWIACEGRSPIVSTHRLTTSDLIEVPDLKNRITAKLNYLLRMEAEYRASAPFQEALSKTDDF